MEDVELTSKTPDSEQIVFNFLEYLQDLKNEGKLSEDNMESVDVATQCLSSAFNIDLTNDVQKKKHSIKPQSLPTIFGIGVNGKEKLTKALEKLHKTHQQVNSGDLESRFAQYIANIKSKGYFNGVEPASAEYEQRFIRARQKFIEKSKKTTATTTTETKTEKMEIDAPPPVPPSLSRDEKNALAEKHKLEGNARLQEKQYAKAIEEYSKAISLSSDNPIYYANRAAAYSHIGKHQEAVEDCKKSIALKPDYGKAYGRLGLAYFSLGKYKDACEQYKKALEYEPNSPTLKESLLAAEKKLQEQGQTVETPSTPPPQANQPPRTPNFADLLSNPNLMNSLGSLFGRPPAQPTSTSTTSTSPTPTPSSTTTTQTSSTSSTTPPRGPLGGRNFNDILGSPQFQQFASQLASNPQIMQMANSLAQNPSAVNNIMQSLGIDPSALEEENSTPPPQ